MPGFHDYIARRQPSLADAAIALGVPVFPCGADKRPLTQHGFKDASADPETVRRMFGPGAVLIGMPTGELTGLVVIDVDVKDGAQGAAWLDANSHRMPQTRTIRTGSGGLHIYLRWTKVTRNSASKIAPGVDVRGDGGYVVVPPSPGYVIADNASIADVPDWLGPVLWPPEIVHVPVQHVRARGTGTAYAQTALDNECFAIRSAAQGTKHDTLNKAAYSIGGLVAAGELDEREAMSALGAALDSIRPSCKDFRAAQRTLATAFRDGKARVRSIPERPTEPAHPAAALIAKLHVEAAPQLAKPMKVSADIMDVPGVLGSFVAHCNATAIAAQPFLALAAGICLIGALGGRRYRTRTNLRTNIYAIGIAESGGGKDHARKRIKAALGAAGLTQYLGGEDIASGAAMLTALNRHPAVLFQIDEVGDWLAGVLGKQAATHKKQIAERLKTLYSSADSFITGTEYADQSRQGRPREDIQQPHACFYGTTTPGQFWAAIREGSMFDGLLARLLIFVTPENFPDEQDPDMIEVPSDLVAGLQEIAGGVVGHGPELGAVMAANVVPSPYPVPETPSAAAAIKRLRSDQIARQRRAEGTYVTSIAARLTENTIKLALVRAVSRDPQAPVIEVADVAWARALAEHCMASLIQDADRYVAATEFEGWLNKALDVIRRHGPISRREMWRKGFKLKDRDANEVFKALTDNGLILAVEDERQGPGRRAVRYVLTVSGNDENEPEPNWHELSP